MATVRRRGKIAAENRYDAAGTGRRIARWNPPGHGPQKALAGFEKLRNRSRDAVANDWAAGSSNQKWVTNLIGTGIQPRFKNKEHRAVWDKFSKQADADGVLDAYGLQVLGALAVFDAGEVFVRRRPRALDAPLDVPVQVQLIESEFCPMLDSDNWPGLPAGHKITQGIERNKYGRRTAYWFFKEHPGDNAAMPTPDQLVRVAAREVSHVYEVRRPGALRGVSPLANILIRLRATGDFEDAVLDRQKIANLFALFITRSMPEDADVDYDSVTGLPVFYGADGAPTAALEPGIAQTLLPGEDVKFANPPNAGVGFSEYLRTNHLGTAAGQGLPYELMSGDIANVSDRTLRVLINEFRRYCQQRQWVTIIPRLCQPMVDWCMDAAALAGLLPLSQVAQAKAPTWTPQGWEYIHPTQDAQGKKILLDMGVVSKSQLITERGDEPEKVFDERQADSEEEDRRGIKQAADGTLLEDSEADPADDEADPAGPTPQQRAGRRAAPQARTDDRVLALLTQIVAAREPQGPTAVEKTLNALVDVVSAMQAQAAATTAALGALAQQLAERPINTTVQNHVPAQPAPVVQIDNHVPAQAAPVVQIDNHVPAQPAPVVNVTNEVDVNLPDRQVTSVIERDPRTGDITNVTQTERTIQ